jgi:hypothetical protein
LQIDLQAYMIRNMTESSNSNETLQDAIKRRRAAAAQEASRARLAAETLKGHALSSNEQRVSDLSLIKQMAKDAVRLLTAQNVAPNLTYQKQTGITERKRFRPSHAILEPHTIWTMRYRTYLHTDSNPSKHQSPNSFKVEEFVGLDASARIHVGFVRNDTQFHLILDNESLLYGPDLNRSIWNIYHDERPTEFNGSPLGHEALVTCWRECFAEGIVSLTE